MQRNAFTLIELLIVITIIMTLVGMSIVGLGTLRERAKIDATSGLISRIETALRIYKEVFLGFPPDDDGIYEGSQCLWYYLYKGLSLEVENDNAPKGFTPGRFIKVVRAPDIRRGVEIEKGIYAKVKPPMGPEGFRQKELNEDNYVIDIWGHPLYYKEPGEDHRPGSGANYKGRNNRSYIDLESAGPNGEFNNDDSPDDDDINNWKRKK